MQPKSDQIIIVIAVLTLLGYSGTVQQSITSLRASEIPPRQTLSVKGHAAFIMMPSKADSKSPQPWVWYAPTLPRYPEARENWMFEKFLAAGIAIAGIDVGESYGSPDGRRIYSAFYKELVTNRRFAPKAALLARSRGGLMLYCWACENPDSVACIAGIYPVCDLRSYPGLDKACGAYGLTRAELEKQLDQHNPVARLAPLARAGVPIFHIHGDVDKTVPLNENSGEVARQYKLLGGKMELKIAPGARAQRLGRVLSVSGAGRLCHCPIHT